MRVKLPALYLPVSIKKNKSMCDCDLLQYTYSTVQSKLPVGQIAVCNADKLH